MIVTSHDANYIPDEENPSNYLVLESHIHQVVNELFSAGEKAVAIMDYPAALVHAAFDVTWRDMDFAKKFVGKKFLSRINWLEYP
ncbi:hypothetical protein [Virgibacillus dakarensis]|uniref:hypothetical protein n=1 Tax=Virgibacillus dakarensis TaxID=1917889 RepID=UPI000B44357D|nr:hypothetical protein [Virgibacillus dakarensis]